MGCFCVVVKSVVELKFFYLEFCWFELLVLRQRFVCIYDYEGLVVLLIYFFEIKV